MSNDDLNPHFDSTTGDEVARGATPGVTLHATPERTLIRPAGSRRHIVFTLSADAQPRDHQPVTLGLTLDRSGSMAGGPLDMAKVVARRIVDTLTPNDQIAILAFDDAFDVVQPLAPVTDAVRAHIIGALATLEAGGSTALHEAWLRGCRLIAGETLDATRISHTLLLTDGNANQGETDTMVIARQVCDIYQQTRIGTSTFGLGASYNPHLLGFMAMAGAGQFTHLKTPANLESSFLGVLGKLRSAALRDVHLEIEAPTQTTLDVVGAFWYQREHGPATRLLVTLEHLAATEQKHIVIRARFPHLDDAPYQIIRARARWRDDDGALQHSAWLPTTFTYASDDACDGERRDGAAMRWVGLDYADRAKRQAVIWTERQQPQHAIEEIDAVLARMQAYANDDPELVAAMRELRELRETIQTQRFSPALSRETYYRQQLRSKTQRDFTDR